jgi:hypothetical protein
VAGVVAAGEARSCIAGLLLLGRPLHRLQLSSSGPHLQAVRIADPPERWAALGFAVFDGRIDVGGVALELGVPGRGIVGWQLRAPDGAAPQAAPAHPNGVTAIDHIVMLTGDFDATAARLEREGMPFRRVREVPVTDGEGFRQGFRRLGPAILEVVETVNEPRSPERFWGITFVASDLDELGRFLGDRLGRPRAAVQPGRRIAALRSAAGIGCAVAFMTPE